LIEGGYSVNIKEYNIDDIIPYARNPRKNSRAVDKVAASIKEFGFQQPIVVDKDNVIIVGHTRWAAAKKLKLKKVPVIIADKLTPQQAKAYRIADNKTHDYSEFDEELLVLELEELQNQNYDLQLTGFEDKELIHLLKSSVDETIDNIQPIPIDDDIQPTAKVGQLYALGDHRLLCGDATDLAAYNILMGDDKVQLVWTDPPYNVAYNTPDTSQA